MTNRQLIWTAIIIGGAAIVWSNWQTIKTWFASTPNPFRSATGNDISEHTCEFVNAKGEIVTIKGEGQRFDELCAKAKANPYSQMHLGEYGYPYYYYPYRYRYYWNVYPYYQYYYFPYYYTWNKGHRNGHDNGNGNGNGGNGNGNGNGGNGNGGNGNGGNGGNGGTPPAM